MDVLKSGIRRLLDLALCQAGQVCRPAADMQAVGRKGDHFHNTWEVFAPLQDSLCFRCRGRKTKRYPQGTLLLVPPGCIHTSIDQLRQPGRLQVLVLSLSDTGTVYGALSVGGARSRESFILGEDEIRWLDASLGMSADTLVARAAAEVEGEQWARERAVARLRLLFAACGELLEINPPQGQDPQTRYVGQVMNMLHSRYYQNDLSVPAVAKAVGLSPSHLERLFRQATGTTVYKSLVTIRLRRAADFLRDSACSIKGIAELTGWSNQLYFSAAFRRHYGMSPSAYRENSAR